jgi:hypothetical protein
MRNPFLFCFEIVGPLFAASLLNRLHLMMTTMLVLTVLTLIAIFFVLKRLHATSKQVPSNDLKDANNHNHSSSLEDEPISTSALPSKNCYVTLVQHDDEQIDQELNSLTKHVSNHSNDNLQNRALNNHKNEIR